jgi:hypothetical protein
VTDAGIDVYPANYFLTVLGGNSGAWGGLFSGQFLQQMFVVLLVPFLSTVAPSIGYNFAGFVPDVANFYTVTGPLSALVVLGWARRRLGGLSGLLATASQRGEARESDPTITFPDQRALVLPANPAPMEAAVNTEDVHMPDGGWVVIQDESGNVVGKSMRRLPAGRFRELKVACRRLSPGPHDLVATLMRDLEARDAYTVDNVPVAGEATVTFPQ